MPTRNDQLGDTKSCHKVFFRVVILALSCTIIPKSTLAFPVLNFPDISTASGAVVVADSDADGITDDTDNCLEICNPNQTDLDSNGVGDACEITSTSALIGSGGLLYDVDFSSPPHTVGLPPNVGQNPAPRILPTTNIFGQPRVVAAVGALTNQPVEFDHIGRTIRLEQTTFGLGLSNNDGGFGLQYPTYHVEMNILVEAMPTDAQFAVFTDSPKAHSVRFRPAGEISAYVLGAGGYDVVIGSYTLGVPMFLEIDLDLVADQWSISIDGSQLFTGVFPSQFGNMRLMRLSMSTAGLSSLVAVDDIRIESTTDTGACCNMTAGICTDAVTATACAASFDRFGGAGSTCTTIDPPCTSQIPTVSEWGLLIFTLLLMAASKIQFNRRKFA